MIPLMPPAAEGADKRGKPSAALLLYSSEDDRRLYGESRRFYLPFSGSRRPAGSGGVFDRGVTERALPDMRGALER